MSVPNFMWYPYWANITCFRKINCYLGCNNYTEDIATFTALEKIYSTKYFCNNIINVAGFSEMFVKRNFSCIWYWQPCRYQEQCDSPTRADKIQQWSGFWWTWALYIQQQRICWYSVWPSQWHWLWWNNCMLYPILNWLEAYFNPHPQEIMVLMELELCIIQLT